jgi:PAS domain S-box-containing protein
MGVQEEGKYRTLVDSMNEGLGVQDANGVITFMNRRACEMLGYDLEELIGKPVTMVFDEENHNFLREQMSIRKHGGRQSYEITWLRKDGGKIDTLVTPNPRYDEQGNLVESIAVFTDIGERKRKESSLKLRLELEHLVAVISGRFVNLPADEVDAGINESLKMVAKIIGSVRGSMFRFSEDLESATNTHEWCADPEDSQIAIIQNMPFGNFGYTRDLLSRSEIVQFGCPGDLPVDMAPGEREWIRRHGFRPRLLIPLVSRGKLTGALGVYGKPDEEKHWPPEFIPYFALIGDIFINALERKHAEEQVAESERKWRTLVEIIPDFIALYDAEGHYLYLNHYAEGYSEKDIRGLHYSALLPEDSRKKYDEAIERCKKTGRPEFVEYTAPGDSGTPRFYDSYIVPLIHKGILTNFIVVARDISDRKCAEEKMVEQMDELKRWQKVMTGREERNLELKKEVNDLLKQLGRPPRYESI